MQRSQELQDNDKVTTSQEKESSMFYKEEAQTQNITMPPQKAPTCNLNYPLPPVGQTGVTETSAMIRLHLTVTANSTTTCPH